MSVFLRWGIFGILAFAGLMYAYNASKHISEKHTTQASPAAPVTEPAEPEPEPVADDGPAVPEYCEAELAVAQRAREARNQNEPIDRLMRMQEIVFAEPKRRKRLERIATFYFNLEGPEPLPAEMRAFVSRNCVAPR